MFDLSSSKLFLLAVIALLVVGPKDLPQLLRTIGRYVGMIKRHANEFRSQFDDAMRDSELADLKKQVEDFGREAEGAVREAETKLQSEFDAVQSEADRTLASIDQTVQGEALPAPDAAAGDAPPADAGQPAPAPAPIAAHEPAPEPAAIPTAKPAAERAGA